MILAIGPISYSEIIFDALLQFVSWKKQKVTPTISQVANHYVSYHDSKKIDTQEEKENYD